MAGAVLLLLALYAGLLGMRWTRSAPTFGDPAAYIDVGNCGVSPDGKTAYLFLQHPGTVTYRDSVWAVDLATLDRELLADAALDLHPLMPGNPGCFVSVPSSDGRHMLGALQVSERSEFFSIDLVTGAVEPIDWAAFNAGANGGGWRFDRIRPLWDAGRGTLRASRLADARAEPFMLDTHREPAVAAADPMQIFYTSSDGVVHHRDARTSADVALSLSNPAGRSLRVSPDARWLALNLGGGRAQLFEVATGHSRIFEHSIHLLAAGDFPVIHRSSSREDRRWTVSGLDGDVAFVTEAPVGVLRPVDGGRFLGLDAQTEAAYLFGPRGERLATLREPATRE